MMIEITKHSFDVERQPEECVFDLDGNRCCFYCGRLCDVSARNWHPGREIDVHGWFETSELRELDDTEELVEALVKQCEMGGWGIAVDGLEIIANSDKSTFRYSYRGGKIVEVERVSA